MKYMVRKYKWFGDWTEWKEVSREVADHKRKVKNYAGFHPYEVREVEEVSE